MKVLIRGIPNFAHVQIVEVEDLNKFVASHELRISRLVTERQTYRRADGRRVMLYIEGTTENQALLERCRWDSKSQAYLELRLGVDGEIRSSGTASIPRLNQGFWYHLEPVRDPRYPELKAKKQAEWERGRLLQEAEDAKEEALRQQVLDAAESLGLEEALRRLQ